jgi:CRISPR system Cascade subunit CasA
MPRRIRLDFRAAAPGEVCGLTGEPDAVVTTSFRTRPWGVRYVNSAHFHPLSPTYRTKPGEPPLAVHPQPDGIGYRHWGSLVGEGDKTDPAAAVTTFVRRAPLRAKSWSEARLVVGGYDMDNMKARAFIEAEMPFFVITDDQRRRSFLTFSRSMAQGATEVAGMLRMQLRIALTIDDSDRALVDSVRQRFFEITTEAFWRTLRIALARDAPASDDDHLTAVGDWLRTMRHHALALFDEVAPLDPLSPGAAGKIKDGKWVPPPVIAARRNLASGLSGYGPKSGEVLFATLGLELPEKRDKPKNRKGSPNG